MGLASLVIGIGAVVLAMLCSAPCFGWMVFLGLPVALVGLGTGLWQLLLSGQRAVRGAGGTRPDMVRYALTGAVLSLVAVIWMGLMLLLKGFVL